MTTKDLIKAEIDRVEEERLDELYGVVKSFARPPVRPERPSLMSRLREIRIDAPEDFSANLDLKFWGLVDCLSLPSTVTFPRQDSEP